jgi:hypothetical protein
MLKDRLLHPFRFIAGTQALILGFIIMAVTAVVAFFSHTHFDGVLDIHYGQVGSPMYIYFAESWIDWAAITLVFYAAGRICSASRIRVIDVAGTLALARAPLLVAALGGWLAVPPSLETLQQLQFTPGLIAQMLLSIVCVVYLVALYYQAYTVSCNVKGSKAVWSFIIGLLIAEVLASIAIYAVFRL